MKRSIWKTAAILVLAAFGLANAGAEENSQKQMLSDAKVDRTHAGIIALGRAPGGEIRNSKIEQEHGRLFWSFEIVIQSTNQIVEVQVNARTGKVVSVKKKTAALPAKEDHRQKH